MKQLILILSIILISFNSFAQVPQSFNYQAVARDNNGNIITNKQVGIKLSIITGTVSGSSVYSETHSPTTSQLGLINLEIGKGTTTENFSGIDWSKGSFYLKVEMDETGGTGYKMIGTSPLLSVPYALYAANVANEKQTLALEGSTLTISSGNSVQLPVGSNSSFDLRYPDGLNNVVSVSKSLNTTTSFTVPAGKNLYIQAAQNEFKIGNNDFNITYPPLLIVGPNQVITGLGETVFISGFYVDAKVEAINLDLKNGDYTVPNGKIFVLLGASDTYENGLLIDGAAANPNYSSSWRYEPIIISEGKVLSGRAIINGYLK